jgi:hypothetical protein
MITQLDLNLASMRKCQLFSLERKKRFIGLTSAHSFKISGNAFQLFSKMKESVGIMIEKKIDRREG